MKKLIILVLLFLSPIIAQTGKSVLSTAQINMIKGFISDSLLTRDQQIDSIFSLLGEAGISDVDSISIILTSSDPPKLQINVTWLDGRVDSLITTRIGQYTLDDLENVLATTPDNNSILIYRQDTGFWETTPYITGGSVSNADSLGGKPANAYLEKADSNLYSTQYDLVSGLAGKKNNFIFADTLSQESIFTLYDVDSTGYWNANGKILQYNLSAGRFELAELPEGADLSVYLTKTAYSDSVKNIDSTRMRILVLDDGENDPVPIIPTDAISGAMGIRVPETVQIEGGSPSLGFKVGNNISDLVPPQPTMSGNWDWMLPDKSGIIALLDDVAGDTLIGTSATLDSLILAFWNNELGGGGGFPQDSLDAKLYASFSTEYPQVSNPSVDNYIPVLTGTGNQYAVLDDLPISSAVSSALSGKQNALGFTPENVSNKATNLTSPDNTKYPTTLAVSTAIETILNEGDARVPYMWVYLELDTIPSMTSFSPATDVEVSTLTESNVIGMNTYDVSYHSISGQGNPQYRTKRGSTWSSWGNTWQILKAVDSAQVRLTSSDLTETTLACTLTAGGQTQIFSVTTLAPVEPVMPDPPTGFIAYGGTSTTEIPMEWTDPEGSIDSIRVYEGSANDTTAMTWIASVGSGVEAYNRTGRTAETTYWYAVKSYDGTNESYFSNTDSATTAEASGDTLGANLLVNGDFETAFSGGNNVWLGTFGATGEQSTEQVYAGTYSVKCITNGGGTGIQPENAYLVLDSAKTYWVEGYIYIVSGTVTYVSASLQAHASQGMLLDVTRDEWVYFSFPVTIQVQVNAGRILFEHYGGIPNVTFYLDNLSIRERLE